MDKLYAKKPHKNRQKDQLQTAGLSQNTIYYCLQVNLDAQKTEGMRH
jgi:hypothetical protein